MRRRSVTQVARILATQPLIVVLVSLPGEHHKFIQVILNGIVIVVLVSFVVYMRLRVWP